MRTTVIALAGFIAIGTLASGQAQRTPASLDDVVTEIRALRADLKQTTRATAQMQLLTARLQLEEQRIATLANQRAEVSVRLGTESQLRALNEAQVQRIAEMKTRSGQSGGHDDLDGMESNFKQQYQAHRDLELQLRTQENQLSSEIANEQNRWQDLSTRLDQLEQSLR